jgi:hypothetical protein
MTVPDMVNFAMSHPSGDMLQGAEDCPEAVKPCLQIVNDFRCKIVRLGKVVQVGEAFVFQPEHIKARLVAGDQLRVGL